MAEHRVVSRRGFLRAAGRGAVGGLAAAGVGSCTGSDGASTGDVPLVTDRPIVTRWSSGIVQVEAPVRELPVAYVSMLHRQVFVDPEFRDRASWLLRAHISVSTWHWRIPLHGDPIGTPIAPGDKDREFEELSIREWDPSMSPHMDDIRIRRGRAVNRRIALDCSELSGVRTVAPGAQGSSGSRPLEAWLSGGPYTVLVSDDSGTDTVREDFQILGTALRFGRRSCTEGGEAVQVVGWAVRPASSEG